MKAVAVIPKKEKSVHLVEMDKPGVAEFKDGRGVLVEVLRVGACGTDREINNAEYGVAPRGADFLVLGHENFGRVVETGEKVKELQKGDFVVATVRRPRGSSIYDQIGEQDFTTDDKYYERGISRLHGYMAEFYAESADFLIKIPPSLAEIAVLLEPLSIIEKGLKQASDIQERLKIWRPKRAAVLGTGNVGLLTVMALRMRGYEVHGFGRSAREGYLNAELCEAIGTTDAVPSDKINQLFVLGNRAMVGTVNANREHFEMGVKDFALCEAMYPGWLGRMLTHRVEGLENFARVFDILENSAKYNAIKTYFEVKKF